ncbi:fimbria/pilus outer membrane usher protein [Vibrio hippocampi]|uniref:Outer membrane usher protein SfmD n=1 Tax=Vibrio hippocampi TaxID=654686 RepID=A0ABN8DN38_9VIBR|nr:fimbria/pilus outer membrane usher protein [Vibrio hippocampi]CAH0530404.1 Outer membrane usher protein SfmD [Vibrio hippocampi]
MRALLLLIVYPFALSVLANNEKLTSESDVNTINIAKIDLANHSSGLNLNFIRGVNQVDPSLFNRLSNKSIPEVEDYYQVYINSTPVFEGITKLNIISQALCVDPKWLEKANVNYALMKEWYNSVHKCYAIEEIGYSTVEYKPERSSVYISIPQLYLNNNRNRDVKYDYGEPGFKLDYQFNWYKNSDRDAVAYGSAKTQLNLGPWVLLNRLSAHTDNTNIESTSTQLYRSLYSHNSELYAGTLYAQPSTFNSFEFYGLTLQTDSSIRDWTQNIYAPVLTGVAQTTARLSVYQNDLLLTEVTVSPGPFEFTNYIPNGNGDIKLVITEDNGETQTKIYPMTTLPDMIRPGISSYAFSIGSKKNLDFNDSLFLNMNYEIGLDDLGLTSSGLLNKNYQAIGLGITKSLGEIGAISLKNRVSNAYNHRQDSWLNGLSLSLQYAKRVNSVTDLRIVGYHYNDKHYVDFSNYTPSYSFDNTRNKNRYELVVNNHFDLFSLNATGWTQDYWGSGHRDTGYDLTLSSHWGSISYSLALSRQENQYSNDNSISFNLGMPLGVRQFLSNSFYYTDSTESFVNNLNFSHQLDDKTSYGLSATSTQEEALQTATARASYRGDLATVSGTVSKTQDRHTVSASIAGSMVGLWNDKSVTLTNNRGTTVAVADIEAIKDVKVNSRTSTNSSGHAVITLSANRPNKVTVNTSDIEETIELDNSIQRLVPTKYSIHHLQYPYTKVERYMFKLVDQHNQAIPFGTQLLTESGKYMTFVANNGLVQFSLTAENKVSTLTSSHANQSCQFELSTLTPYQYGEPIQNVYCK